MRFSDILHTCSQNLFRRKSRTILTVLGVVVGCCSIVLMISIGQGINERNEQMLKSMGSLNILEDARTSAARQLVPIVTAMGFDERNITVTFRKGLTIRDLSKLIKQID